MKTKFLTKKRMKGANKYDYCPICWNEVNKVLQDPKIILNPAWYATTNVRYKTQFGYRTKVESFYICDRCHAELSHNEWIRAWCFPEEIKRK